MGDVRGDFLGPPHDTTPATVMANLVKKKYGPFIRRKIKIALFPLTCRRRGRVGRSENLFIFCVFFSFLKMGKKVETC